MKTNKTTAFNPKKVTKTWWHIDAKDKILGKVAVLAANKLIGKNRAEFSPNQDLGDKVVITNSSKILVTGNKLTGKIYYRHTGFPHGLRSESLQHALQRDSTYVLRKAIKGMLPRNKLS